jgi:hypothetical protein
LKINEKQKELDYFSKLLNVDTNNQQVPLWLDLKYSEIIPSSDYVKSPTIHNSLRPTHSSSHSLPQFKKKKKKKKKKRGSSDFFSDNVNTIENECEKKFRK